MDTSPLTNETISSKSIDISRKKRQLAECEVEVEVLKCVEEMTREMQRLGIGGPTVVQSTATQSRQQSPVIINESMKAMLNYFDELDKSFDVWQNN